MTPEEREMLTDLADKIARTPAPAHDAEADEFIRTNIGKRPDVLYILTQTALIQNLAIQHAQQEIQALKQRLAQAQPAPAEASSFLGGAGATGGMRSPGMPASPPTPFPASVPPPLPQSAPPPAEGPGFLRSAAQTAAGVAAGAFAFEGIRALFGSGGFGGLGLPHFGGFGAGNYGGGSFLGGSRGEETVINNYYDSPDASRPDRSADAALADADAAAASDDRNVSYEDTAADSHDSAADGSSADDSPVDDSSADNAYDDSGSYDDGGSSGGDDLV